MRIVELQRKTGTARHRLARAVGTVSGVFTAILIVLLVVNNTALRSADPINSASLERMKLELATRPEDQQLRQEIRELDLLVRRAYFSGEEFNRIGIWLIVIFGALMVGALKYAESLEAGVPYPDPDTPKRDLKEEAHFARGTFLRGALILVGFAASLALFWESPLDTVGPDGQPIGGGAGGEGALASAAGSEAAPAAEPEPSLPTLTPPAAEELRANWPSFLGAVESRAPGASPPTDWEAEGVVQWQTKIALAGFGSPIVWKNHVLLAGGDSQKRELYGLDATTGELRWTTEVKTEAATAPKVSSDTGFAAATMATEGNYGFAIFATGDLVAVDFDGKLVWQRHLGVPDNPYGHASSLLVVGDRLIVQWDQREDARLLAVDLRDGSTIWEVPREFGASWASPELVEHDGRQQIVVAAAGAIAAYDPIDGKELWQVEALDGAEVACTPVYADGLVYVAADYAAVVAIDVAKGEVAWEYDYYMPSVSTPLVTNGLYFAGLGEGGILCLDASTGEEVWFEETDDGFYASPVLVGDQVWLMDRYGKMHVFAPTREFTSVATPALPEEAVCTPAFIDGALFVRGVEHLYRIGS